MAPEKNRLSLVGKERRYNAPWERAFWVVVHPLDRLVHYQAASGLVLLAATIMALLAANTGLAPWYHALIDTPVALTIGSWSLEEPLRLWVNDGLMAVFFLSIGLEIKRELVAGELASFDRAILPFIAALGGMIVPALIFLAINPTAPAAYGWGAPMATDIAFVIGALSLLGKRAPATLYVFLVTLAVADDLGAVMVIALFYTATIETGYLIAAGILTLLLLAANRGGIRWALVYALLGVGLWFVMLKSGVHATLAGVIVAFAMPVRSKSHPALFTEKMRDLLMQYEATHNDGQTPHEDDDQFSLVQALKQGADQMGTPMHFMLERLRAPVGFLVLPIFAFVNAGLPLGEDLWRAMEGNTVWLGVFLGLVVGKFLGIFSFSLAAVRLGIATLPTGIDGWRLAGGAILAGIGFTMSMFISTLAYRDYPELHLTANAGILLASVTAAVVGFAYFTLLEWFRNRP